MRSMRTLRSKQVSVAIQAVDASEMIGAVDANEAIDAFEAIDAVGTKVRRYYRCKRCEEYD